MAIKIEIEDPKGYAGKTSTTISLGAALSIMGNRVLLIDSDTQGSMSVSVGLAEHDSDEEHNLAALYKQRSVKPSELAKACRMGLDYAKERSGTGIGESRAIDRLAAKTGLSTDKLYRYIRLSKLIPALLALVDAGQIGITPAAQLARLDDEAQNIVLNAIRKTHCPNMAQAEALNKRYRMNGSLTLDDAIEIISGKKTKSASKPATPKVCCKMIKRYFAKDTKEEDALALMQMLLEDYAKERGDDGMIKL